MIVKKKKDKTAKATSSANLPPILNPFFLNPLSCCECYCFISSHCDISDDVALRQTFDHPN